MDTILIATAKPNRHTLSMIKKRAPEQYAAKPKVVAVKSNNRPTVHPAFGVAKALVSWMARGGLPPSIILLHGLHLARSPENDGLPVDMYRPQLTMQGTDNKAISAILDALARPQADKTQVIAEWLQSIWVKKSAGASRIIPSKKRHRNPTVTKKPVRSPKTTKSITSAKPTIEVKKKR